MAPLIVITGPTASGKSGLALELAERYGGEIICADSRTIYRGMNIGTAKPTAEEQARVPHHLLDVVEPGQRYNVKQFQQSAFQKISEIRARGNVPFLVGGTGLYIDAVILEYRWPEVGTPDEINASYDDLTTDELQKLILQRGLELPENSLNRRHLVSTLSRSGEEGKRREKPREGVHVVAIATEKQQLAQRIEQRAIDIFARGVVAEAETLARRYAWENEAMTSNIYPILRRLIDGKITKQQAIEQFIVRDRQLAKRQLTWLRRHDFLTWLTLDEARHHIEQILSSNHGTIERI